MPKPLAFMVMPYCFLQAAVARPVLNLVFGTKWQAAIPLVEILSIGLAFDAVSWVAGALMLARGEFRTSFVYSCIAFPIFFGLITLGAVYFSALGVAVAVSIFYVALAPIYSYRVFRKVGISLGEVAASYLPPVAFAAMAALSAVFLSAMAPLGDLARTLVIAIVGSVIYLVLVRLFAPSTFHQLVARMGTMIPAPVRRVMVTQEAEFGTGIPPAV